MPDNASLPGYPPTYYSASVGNSPQRPSLKGEQRHDVCIVGGGFTGLSAALELAQKGLSVIVLESERLGWGASGRNGGQLINGYSRPLDVIGKRYGADVERALGGMALEGAAIIRERAATHAIDCDLVDGAFAAALSAKQLDRMRDLRDIWARHGHGTMQIVDKAGVADIVKSNRYVGGLVDPLGGHFHPLKYLLGEARIFETLGGVICEHSRALRIEKGAQPTVVTAQGCVKAQIVLLCGNAYLGETVPELTHRIMPVSSQIITTEPLGALAEELLPHNHCVEDANYVLDYFRRTSEGRLLYGGGVVYGGQDRSSIEARIRPGLEKTFPQLRGVRLDYTWSGNFALTLTRVPQIGRLGPNIYFSHGDSGHGVTTTQLLGRLLSEAVTGQLGRFDAFANLPYYAFPGGRTFRVPVSVLGSWYYSLRDRLGV